MKKARHLRAAALLAAFTAFALPASAQACSQDDTAYFDGFLDTSCLTTMSGTTLDTFGGLRLTTDGTPTTSSWDTAADFSGGVSWEGTAFAPVGTGTLATDTSGGSGPPAKLVLPETLLPLSRDGADPVLSPTAATVLDNDDIGDPSVVKIGSTYMMWYSGTAEDGSGPAIFVAESADGQTWTRTNSGNPVLQRTAGAFDEHGVSGPDVVYEPGDAGAPYKMWYAGQGEIFGAIGYATSSDGVNWTKYDDPSTPAPADPVLGHGTPGSPDSFAAADPSVLRDGTTWKMWYTGDDSNKRRIAYATSSDGVHWTKGGKVISPEDPGANANYQFGAFAPTVWKTTNGYRMLLAGRKNIGTATNPVYQTRIMGAESSDGIAWTAPSPVLNPSGTVTNFDYSNLDSPFVLEDPGTLHPYKLYYAGNTLDANGNGHDRIGLATSSSGSSFSKEYSSGPAEAMGAVLDIGALGTAFDARQASGLSVTAPAGAEAAGKFVGFYWGNRGSDFKPRLGEAASADGSAWTKVPGTLGEGGSLLALGNNAAFDNGGQRDPSVLYDGGTYYLYFTGISSGGVPSIGLSSTAEIAATHQPDNAAWTATASKLAGDGSGFDATSVSHPSVIKTGASSYVMYYTGTASGVSKIGRATASSPNGPWARGPSPVLDLGAAGSFDASSVKDPVVFQATEGAPFRMLYTGVEKLEGTTIERVGYATSSDGISWTKQGVALNPSQAPFAADESGVEPAGALVDGSTLHVWTTVVDRTGRTRGDHATTGYPTPAVPTSGIPNGWATYQLGNETTSARDFRSIVRASGGSDVQLWMSYEQPYSTGGTGGSFWSGYFPVTVGSTSEALSFLLSVHGVRWQARLSEPSGSPSLDRVEIVHAPVQFSPSGTATTGEIAPPAGVSIAGWTSLTVGGSLLSPTGAGSGSGSVQVLSANGGQELASQPLSTSGDTTIDLSGISFQSDPALRVRLNLASESPFSATPLVRSLKVLYSTVATPPPPPPPPAPKIALLFRKKLRSKTVLKRGVRGKATCDEPCVLKLAAKGLRSASGAVASAGQLVVFRLKLTAATKRKLKAHKKVRLVLKATGAATGGASSVASVKIRILP